MNFEDNLRLHIPDCDLWSGRTSDMLRELSMMNVVVDNANVALCPAAGPVRVNCDCSLSSLASVASTCRQLCVSCRSNIFMDYCSTILIMFLVMYVCCCDKPCFSKSLPSKEREE